MAPLESRIFDTLSGDRDITSALELLKDQGAAAVLVDKAYDSNDLRQSIADMQAEAVIPSKQRNRKVAIPYDADVTSTETASNAASIASSTFVGSPRAMIGEQFTSQASSTSPQQ